MITEKGTVTAKEVLLVHSNRLESDITSLVLEDTPEVLTIGGRCANQGFGFHWPPYTRPYFEAPGFIEHDEICELTSINNAPCLVDEAETLCPAGVDAERTSPAPRCPIWIKVTTLVSLLQEWRVTPTTPPSLRTTDKTPMRGLRRVVVSQGRSTRDGVRLLRGAVSRRWLTSYTVVHSASRR